MAASLIKELPPASAELARQARALAANDDTRPVHGAEIIQGPRDRDLQFRPTIEGWTPDLVRVAGDAADMGQMLVLADLVDAMMADDRIDGVLQTLTFNILGLPLSFLGGDPGIASLLAGPKDIGGEWDRMSPQGELVKLLSWGCLLGIGFAQRVPLPRLYGQPQCYRLQTWHPRWFSYDHQGATGSHWRVQTRSGMRRVIPGAQWVVYQPFGDIRPWNEGKWRRLAFPWLVKHFSAEDRANQGEAVGSLSWVGSSPQGGTETQRRTMLQQLKQLGRNGRIVLPAGWGLDMVESEGRTWDLHNDSIEWADQAITIILAGQVTTTEGSAGFDSGKSQDAILASVMKFYAKGFASCLSDQHIKPWVRANRGDDSLAPCLYWMTERNSSQAAQATTWETIGRAVTGIDAALSRSGKRVDGEAVANLFGIPYVSDAGAPPIIQAPGKTPPNNDPKRPPGGGGMNDVVLP